MEKSLQNIEKIIEKTKDESYRSRLKNAAKIISQNRKKIWLRTKTGKPFAEKTFTITEQLVLQSECKVFIDTLNELEDQVRTIHEESIRRSMVVT
jgi:hypothetical protein